MSSPPDSASPASVAPVRVDAWTDGACSGNPGPGGWGAITQVGGREACFFGGINPTTNNIMELHGVLFVLESTLGRLPAGSTLSVRTDSQYVQKGVTEWLAGWKRKGWRKADGKPVLNAEWWQRLDAALLAHRAAGATVSVLWTRGHAGDALNERADALARMGASRSARLPRGSTLPPARTAG
jgi:ribonuclease HI